MAKRKTKYKARPNSAISDKTAEIVGRELERMEAEGVARTPTNLVERAAADNGPLGYLFDWDDESAAYKFRIHYARKLIGSVLVVRIDQRTPRAYEPIKLRVKDGPKREYERHAVVVEDEDALDQLTLSIYGRMVSEARHADDLGLCERDPAMRRVVSTILGSPPKAAR